MLSKVQSALTKLLSSGESLLVGVSGGADSVALLDVLVQSGYRPHICHLNHQWRGKESDADADLVRELAGKYGLPVTIEARKVAGNEDAARQARLEFFESLGVPNVALAHTADDQVETILMRLIRGAGATGLAGMAMEKRIGSLRILRPLLNVTRDEVLKYLRTRELKWREDASNADRSFLRNRIRHELLPLLERDYNPGIRDVLLRTAEILRAEAKGDPVAAERRTIRQLNFAQVEALRQLAADDDWKIATAGKWPLNLAGETSVLGVRLVVGDDGQQFDADVLGDAPFIRTWQAGDRFQPLGMTGEKKLQDFFVDEKIPRRQRGRVPLLCAADGRIAWVVGHRVAEPFKVTERTQRVLRIGVRG